MTKFTKQIDVGCRI